MMYLAAHALFLLLGISSCGYLTVEATKGIDVSTFVSQSAFNCFINFGYEFLIVRGYRSNGSLDPNALQTMANAREAGIRYIDVYMFPCPKCNKSASIQVKEMVNSLDVNYGQIWLDIEGSQYWTGSYSSNQNFFEELLSEASKYKTTGVYASEYQWSSIMDRNYTGGSSHQLWYAHYDDDPSFNDFKPFGGWSKPSVKQYAGDKTVCGAGVDLNYHD